MVRTRSVRPRLAVPRRASSSGRIPLRRMNAMTTSIRSAEPISARTWLPTRGSPGAFVSSVVSSNGMSGSRNRLCAAVRAAPEDRAQHRPGRNRSIGTQPRLNDRVQGLDQLSRKVDACLGAFPLRPRFDRSADEPRQDAAIRSPASAARSSSVCDSNVGSSSRRRAARSSVMSSSVDPHPLHSSALIIGTFACLAQLVLVASL